ncbi:MAG: fatty acid desaturase [Patescibacteria group bacterium]|nr:fatty acid desaturase [Patescibacteria group bacterium]MDE2015658.1 fatty acid desaturase [Patescibacteria group bacterium]MDE2226715.1 fatty acid desaturase [Patescibacteria group bacterium]
MLYNILGYFFFYALLGFILAEAATLLTTVYLHRSTTHCSVKFHPRVEFFMQGGLWLTTGINRIEWAAVHRYHHNHTDVDGDPHSPILLGLWAVQLGNLFLYRKAAKRPEVLACAKNIKPTLAEETIFKSPKVGLAVGIGLLYMLVGFRFWPTLIIAGTHTFLYLFFLNNLINGWCHVRGYKNFKNKPAFNNRLIAWITMGEGLHNNHHHKPGNPSLRYKWSEVDLGWIFIRLLCSLKLATLPTSR